MNIFLLCKNPLIRKKIILQLKDKNWKIISPPVITDEKIDELIKNKHFDLSVCIFDLPVNEIEKIIQKLKKKNKKLQTLGILEEGIHDANDSVETLNFIKILHLPYQKFDLGNTIQGMIKEKIDIKSSYVLTVDDSMMIRSHASQILTDAGYYTLTAEDGKQAWDLLTGEIGENIDIVITDLNMPVMNDEELCLKIRNHKTLGMFRYYF